jgi:hypothetical protein
MMALSSLIPSLYGSASYRNHPDCLVELPQPGHERCDCGQSDRVLGIVHSLEAGGIPGSIATEAGC